MEINKRLIFYYNKYTIMDTILNDKNVDSAYLYVE